MKNTKYLIGILLLFMTIGFAAISTSLTIAGKTTVTTTIDDFKVYFSDVKVNGVQDLSLVVNETTLDFGFYIEEVGTSYTIDYDVTNGSKYYDASLSMSCTNGNNYLSIVNTFDTSTNLVAKDTRSGSLVMKKIKTIASDEVISNRVVCTLTASPVERTTINNDDAMIPVSKYAVGREIAIGEEKFNIISDNGNMVSMFAQYNLGTDYRQTTTSNRVAFSVDEGWDYAPGPKEIDIQEWSSGPKEYINSYLSFLEGELGIISLSGDLISLMQLKDLGCTIPEDYISSRTGTCADSPYISWIYNSQYWWTKSAGTEYSFDVWITSGLSMDVDHSENANGIRPVITISKTDLENYI